MSLVIDICFYMQEEFDFSPTVFLSLTKSLKDRLPIKKSIFMNSVVNNVCIWETLTALFTLSSTESCLILKTSGVRKINMLGAKTYITGLITGRDLLR